jgi:asparagine synthase (glutamine-hydrolysing)
MYALAVFDVRAQTLLLARDPSGIKPLFYAAIQEASRCLVVFASEIAPIQELTGYRSISHQAASDYAALGYVPAPLTMFTGIHAVEPGTTVTFGFQQARVTVSMDRFHRWMIAPDPGLTLSGAVDRTAELLASAVRTQAQADVPVGLLLSGGIDSSLIAASASRGGMAPRSFSVAFDDAGYDESWAARAVARDIGLEHQSVSIPRGAGSLLHTTQILSCVGQPFSDSSLLPAYWLMSAAKRHATVCLGGEGGDEGFGGYAYFGELAATVHMGVTRAFPELIADRLTLLDAATHSALCRELSAEPVLRLFEPRWDYRWDLVPTKADVIVAQATEAASRLPLVNDYLVKVDTASMAHGLEVRVPMLDEDLFAFALTLPTSLKVGGHSTKPVLRELARRLLPAQVATKPKWGFSVPPHEWLSPSSRAAISERLLDPSAPVREYYCSETFLPWVSAFRDGRTVDGVHELYLFDRILLLLSMDIFVGTEFR